MPTGRPFGEIVDREAIEAFGAVADGAVAGEGAQAGTGHGKPQSVDARRQRLWLVSVVFLACFVLLAGRTTQLALFAPEAASSGRSASSAAGTSRVSIVDRKGELLATDLRVATVFAEPQHIWDVDETIAQLKTVLPDLDDAVIRARLSSDRKYAVIRRDISPQQRNDIHSLGLPGIAFEFETRRFYLQNNTLSHVLGFVDRDNRGIAGLELGLDARLRDTDAGPLSLSIDLSAQHAVRDELAKAMAKFSAKGAAGLVMDVATGELLALVSLPDFNLNAPGEASADAQFNRAALGVYEMGSTFKCFTTAMALESGKVSLASRYDARQPIRIGRHVISDFHAENRWLTVPEIFTHSSNIGSAKMALDIGIDAHRRFLAKLGLLDRPALELAEVGAPLVPEPWREINTMTIAFGHGMAVSPVQLAKAIAPLVNGGFLVEPTLVERSGEDMATGPRVVSEKTNEAIRGLLRQVVQDGTGKKADVAGYAVGGKTGTAEKARGRGYDRKALISSFLAIFPAQKPRYLVFVLLDEPKGIKETFGFATAGWTAAPTVANVIGRVAPILRVNPVWDVDPTKVASK